MDPIRLDRVASGLGVMTGARADVARSVSSGSTDSPDRTGCMYVCLFVCLFVGACVHAC